MSNQEQQFSSQEEYPPVPQQSYQYYSANTSVNTDPREQQQEMYGEPQYYASRGEKLQPRPLRRKRFRVFWVLPLIVLLIGGISYSLFGSHEHSNKHFGSRFGSSDYKHVFDSGVTPKIIIYNNAGTIHVHTDEDSTNARLVTIHMEQNGPSNSEPVPTTNFDNATGTITVTMPQQGFGDRGYDIDVTTPKQSNVQLSDSNGDINIEDVTGVVSAQTSQGKIDAHDVNGQVTFLSTDGDVSLEDGSLRGQSFLHSDNGDIRYNGSIDPQGKYKFDTINGSVDVRLPSNSAFHLEPHSTNDFDNEFGSDDVGGGTRPPLIISSENGSIHFSKSH